MVLLDVNGASVEDTNIGTPSFCRDPRGILQARCLELIEKTNPIHVFKKRSGFHSYSLAWRLRRQNGAEWREVDQREWLALNIQCL